MLKVTVAEFILRKVNRAKKIRRMNLKKIPEIPENWILALVKQGFFLYGLQRKERKIRKTGSLLTV